MLATNKVRDCLASLPDSRICNLKWRSILRYATVAFIVSVTLSGIFLFRRPEGFLRDSGSHYFEYFWNQTANHPIDQLINDAHTFHENLLKQRSFDLPTAAARYRERRGRHPPPGFDAWFKYAIDHDAIIVESFFDRINADIAPYWGLDAQTTAERAASWSMS